MTTTLRSSLLILFFFAQAAWAAPHFTITVRNDSGLARPSETIVVPFSEVKTRLPNVIFDQVIVRDGKGKVIPSQVTSFVHSHKGPQQYNDLIFQHDFAAKEKSATFAVETSAQSIPPFPSKVYVRYAPERYDDFAWENDRIAHRAYGPALELPSAGKDQMTSSGLDIWSKKVRYSIIDHWYHKGHDGLHTDTGEGSDMYEVGLNRGAGGTGIWNGESIAVSKDYRAWKILANGPVRAIFELSYEPWDAGNGVMVSEVKRFTVDAGHNFDAMESTFTFTPKSNNESLTVAVGLSQHTTIANVQPTRNEPQRGINVWEEYKDDADGNLGTAVLLAPDAEFAGFAEIPGNPKVSRLVRPDLLVLAKVHSGQPLHYFIGAGWNKSGDFKTKKDWDDYVAAYAARIRTPITVSLSSATN